MNMFLTSIRHSLADLGHDVSHLSDEELDQKVKVAHEQLKAKDIDVNDGDTYLSTVFQYIN